MATTQLHNIPSHSFSIRYVLSLSYKIVTARYHPNFSDAGSLATVRDLPVMIATNLFYKFERDDGNIIIQRENVKTYKEALGYLQISIKNEAQDIWNKGHQHGALRRDKETGLLKRPRHMYSTEMPISDDSSTTLIDVLASGISTPEQQLRYQETYRFAKFIDELTTNILLHNSTCIMGELTNIPSLSSAGLLKHCMYAYGIEYAESSAENENLHTLIQTLWSQSTLPSAGLIEWNANLSAMKSDLLSAEANFSFIVKQYILRAIKPEESIDDLFASDTPRESLRKSLGHSEAGIALLNLVTLMHLRNKDEYQEQMTQTGQNLLETAMKVFSEARKNFRNIEDMQEILESLLEDDTNLTRDAMRQFLAPVVYDQCFDDITTRKQNTIRRLIRSVGMLSEGLRPLIIRNQIPLTYKS